MGTSKAPNRHIELLNHHSLRGCGEDLTLEGPQLQDHTPRKAELKDLDFRPPWGGGSAEEVTESDKLVARGRNREGQSTSRFDRGGFRREEALRRLLSHTVGIQRLCFQLHGARRSCDGQKKEHLGPHQAAGHVEERPNNGDVEDESREERRQHERTERFAADAILQVNWPERDGDSCEDFEDELRAGKLGSGRGRYLGVGPGVHLPTRMHYFGDGDIDEDLAEGSSGRGLRRIPVIDFGPLLVRNTLGTQSPNTIQRVPRYTSPLHPRNRCAPHRPSQDDDHRAVDFVLGSELGDAANGDSDSSDADDNGDSDDNIGC